MKAFYWKSSALNCFQGLRTFQAMYRKRPLLEERRKLIRELELSNLDGKFIASQAPLDPL